VGGPDKSSGAIAFVLNFLWLLSLFQDKESNKGFEQLDLPDFFACCMKLCYSFKKKRFSFWRLSRFNREASKREK